MFSWAKQTNKNGNSLPAIKTWQLDSFLINSERTQPKEWSVDSSVLLKYTIFNLRKNHSKESVTINTIETAVDAVVKEYKKHGKKPTAAEVTMVKTYMAKRFKEYTTPMQSTESHAANINKEPESSPAR